MNLLVCRGVFCRWKSLKIADKVFCDTSKTQGRQMDLTAQAGKTAEIVTDQTYIRYKTIFENTGTATILIEDDMTISMVNTELERISGITKDDIQGKMTFPELVAEPDRERVMENHRKRRQSSGSVPRNYPCRILVPNNGVRECILTVALIQGTRQSVASITDISRQKQLERKIAKVSEEERQQMGQVLHDDLGSHLAGVEAMSSLLASRLEKKNHKDAALAKEIQGLVNQAIQKTRAMVRGLVPVCLEATGFMAAVQQMCRDVEKAFGIFCQITDKTCKPGLSNTAALTHIYYIIRESVHNAVRHGKAARIEVVCFEDLPDLVVEVRDNGIGMPGIGMPGIGMPDPGSCPVHKDGNSLDLARQGMGLTIMQHRADLIGARLAVLENGSGGTIIRCRIEKKYLS
jgi:PAS domain S-box-containing protein